MKSDTSANKNVSEIRSSNAKGGTSVIKLLETSLKVSRLSIVLTAACTNRYDSKKRPLRCSGATYVM